MKLTPIIIAVFAISAPTFAQVSLTGFGTGDYTDASQPAPAGPTSFSQSASSVTVSLTNDGQLQGTFSSTSTGFASSLSLTATKTSSQSFPFSVELFDGSSTQSYSGNWGDFPQGTPTTATLTFGPAVNPGFNFATVQGVIFTMGGTSGQTVSVTLDQLTAVPEPSTYAAIFGVVCLGVAILRKKKQRAAAPAV